MGWFRRRKINYLQNCNKELNKAIVELDELRESTQMYAIRVNPKLDTKESTKGYFMFNQDANMGVCFVGKNYAKLIAHEFKQMYQFETGSYSQNTESNIENGL